MLEMRPTCENCNVSLPPDSTEAMICTFECTFCHRCVEEPLENVCPNCGGGFSPRPVRPATSGESSRCIWFVVAAFAVSVVSAVGLSFIPVQTAVTHSVQVELGQERNSDPSEVGESMEVRRQTLPQAQGWGAVAAISLPLLLTAFPLFLRRGRPATMGHLVSTVILFFGVLVGAMSFGILYLVPAVLMLSATVCSLGRR